MSHLVDDVTFSDYNCTVNCSTNCLSTVNKVKKNMSTDLQQQLNELKDSMPRGYVTIIANRLNITRGTVYNALNGKKSSHDQEIVEAALALLKQKKEQDQQLAQKIEDALKATSNS